MGTKVQNLLGYYSMRDLNEESSSCGWPLFYGDKTLTNAQYYNNYLPSATSDACSAYDKDVVKRKMLEHEEIFRNQVCELHRLYRMQKHLMDEVKRKELHRNQISVGTSFTTGALASQITSEDGQKRQIPGFPMANSVCARPSISDVEGIHSPLGSIKGNSKQANLFPSPNGSSSKDVEVLDSRPSKVRRKMFDLQLPADEYIDTEESEKLSDEKTSGTTVYLPDRNCELGKESDVKFFCGNGGKTGSQEDSSKCEQSLRSRNGLTDLNEPVQMEETNGSAYVHLLSHNPSQGGTECSEPSAKQESRIFGLSREDLLNSHSGTDGRARHNGYLESNGSGKGWIPSMLEAGQAKSNLKPISEVLKQDKSLLSSQSLQDAYNKVRELPSDYLSNRSKANLWSERTVCDLETSERSHDISLNKHPESVVSSHRPSLFAVPSSDVTKSWSHSSSSWELANSSLTQKSMSVQMPPFLNPSGALSKSSHSGQSNGIFGDDWSRNMNSKSNPGFRCEVPGHNGFYPGSSSGSKEPSMNVSSISYDYLNRNNDCRRFPEHFVNHGSAKYDKVSICDDVKPGKDINLNVLLSHSSSDNLVPQTGQRIIGGELKHEEHLSVLPWLRPKLACKYEVQNADRGLNSGDLSFLQGPSVSNKDETGKGPSGNFMHRVMSNSCSNGIESRRTEVRDSSSNKKILGVPIFDMPHISPKESSSLKSHSASFPNPSDVEAVEKNRKNQVFDINLPCDPAILELDKEVVKEATGSEKGSPTLEGNARNQIDLNLSMSEDEEIPSTDVKMKAEIDLEVPAVAEMEEDVIPEENQLETPLVSEQVLQDKAEQQRDELMMNAAEAIVAMSSLFCNQVDDIICSPSESPMVDPLSWFADVVSTCADDVEGKSDTARGKDGRCCNEECCSEGMEYFEYMTLQLAETKEEDYMPKPLVPENFNVEETGMNVLPTRTRRGPARRGRQRRDFQRDILPGLASLLRHEVTEDLQTFGGLMRATGHAWSGLTRRNASRNGCGRGRRWVQVTPSPPAPPPPPHVVTNGTCAPLIHQLTTIEIGLEDRSLTGWGKTTRRPRRQRCPASNPPPSIPLT
ncbi:hypothetical protein L6164_020859 [Bauhinia variegata]|uniref:Uncharacterized protein n=1 Tax=Bauhinia variegata TaxID=167791 RepID=A0ACB9MYF4_BAUVA|nr:hypothetical protein L6164_020859 [Bauhinia variegata]